MQPLPRAINRAINHYDHFKLLGWVCLLGEGAKHLLEKVFSIVSWDDYAQADSIHEITVLSALALIGWLTLKHNIPYE